MTAAPIPPTPPPGPISPAAASASSPALPADPAPATTYEDALPEVPATALITPVPSPIPFLRDIPDLPAIPGISVLTPSFVPAAAVVTPVRRPWAAAYRLLVAAAAAAAVVAETLTGPPLHVLSHFAIQANILLALVLAASARRAWTARRPLPATLTGAAVLYVTIAALVDHLLLAGTTPPFSITGNPGSHPLWQSTAAHLIHTAIPLAALLDWLLLTVPARPHLRQAAPWLLYPLAYLAFILTRGEVLSPATGDHYLYPFLDVARHGYKHVLGNALLVGLSCYALALLLIATDQARPNPVRHRRSTTGFRLRPPVG
ncbi:Pr6Pr family membrane protein [Streptomyces seoulensis]|nr:Pr6Pr family membrane protein [Streptomyces seoulensis]